LAHIEKLAEQAAAEEAGSSAGEAEDEPEGTSADQEAEETEALQVAEADIQPQDADEPPLLDNDDFTAEPARHRMQFRFLD